VFLAVVGILLLVFVPWFIDMVVFAVVLILFEKGRRRYGVRYGACPHCAEMISISSHLIAINCPICTKRIFVKGQEFRAV
jgi:DNA-directed RNA polymerase subunit RPC12/RpoP